MHRCVAKAVGNLASVVAFSAFDVADYAAADRCFEFALWYADEAGSWALRANTLAEMARKAAYLGDLDDALELIEFAQVRSDRLTATAQADVDRADVHFADHDPDVAPPWLCYYDRRAPRKHREGVDPPRAGPWQPRTGDGTLNAAIRLQAVDYPPRARSPASGLPH